MNLDATYRQEGIEHLAAERFGLAQTALRQALLLRPDCPESHRALLTCSGALERWTDALYHGTLFEELAGLTGADAPRLTALIGRAAAAYAEGLARLGIAEAATFQAGAQARFRQACALAPSDPLLRMLCRFAEGTSLPEPQPISDPLYLHYLDPFLSWGGRIERRVYMDRLAERLQREGTLIRYVGLDLTAGVVLRDGQVTSLEAVAALPIRQVWELTAGLGLEEGRPLQTLTFIQPEEGPMQILVEPLVDRLSARREILLLWDAAGALAA
jgi:hypothetical protein